MKTELHPAKERGHVQQGWLDTWHSFSFGSYQNPKRQGFGALLVLNDDTIAPGKGFGSHPHEEMEIITIPIKGSLEHKDSTGKGAVLKPGDVQVMSAGTGLLHSEFNASKTEPLHLFQIWIQPSDMAVKPRHAEKHFAFPEGKLVTVAGQKEGLFINQDASVKLG
ncbi:MAG: pirin family protein, partial [Nanoarchaeota archaeon]|nr:pirin family protein [Nanoarchaeota archaeon]